MVRLSRTSLLVAVAALVVIAAVITLAVPAALNRRSAIELRIATSTRGSTSYALGHQFARILAELPRRPIESARVVSSAGSSVNIASVARGEADLALVFEPALIRADEAERAGIRVLARLYMDVAQVVVRTDSGILDVEDLRGKRVYIGSEGSGTRIVSQDILAAVGVSEFTSVRATGYDEAAEKLLSGELDAAFFVAGAPAAATKRAMDSRQCRLLDLGLHVAAIADSARYVEEVFLPAHIYAYQAEPVRTVGAHATLICRSTLSEDLANLVDEALFSRLGDLLMAHAKAREIHVDHAFAGLPAGIALHPGAQRFRESEDDKLEIATGAIDGAYHDLGERLQVLLEQSGIPARAVHTDGSVENARLLKQRPTVAIMQYDVALTSYWGMTDRFYGSGAEATESAVDASRVQIPNTPGMRRIATLHPEALYIVARRDRLAPGSAATIAGLDGLRVCVGPANSGTRAIAEAVLRQHAVTPGSVSVLPVQSMVRQLRGGDLDAGFFVSYVPRGGLEALLHDAELVLLSVERDRLASLLGPALQAWQIPAGTYACQQPDERAVDTIQTRAILATTADLPFDVGVITEAVFTGADFPNVDGGVATLRKDLPSIPLHPDAKAYYEDMGYLPSPKGLDLVTVSSIAAACFTVLFGAWKGALILRRDWARRWYGRRIRAVASGVDCAEVISELLSIREVVRASASSRWWERRQLDEGRAQYLEDLIGRRVQEAREDLVRKLLADVREASEMTGQDTTEAARRRSTVEQDVLRHFEQAELDEAQTIFLRGMLAGQATA